MITLFLVHRSGIYLNIIRTHKDAPYCAVKLRKNINTQARRQAFAKDLHLPLCVQTCTLYSKMPKDVPVMQPESVFANV
jgi:hypothetical protein